MSPIKSLELSLSAEKDIKEIFEYSIKEFGETQAVKYLLNINSAFSDIVNYPEIGRTRDEIKKGLRSLIVSSHIIFYRVIQDKIRIVRVLHGSRDFLYKNF